MCTACSLIPNFGDPDSPRNSVAALRRNRRPAWSARYPMFDFGPQDWPADADAPRHHPAGDSVSEIFGQAPDRVQRNPSWKIR